MACLALATCRAEHVEGEGLYHQELHGTRGYPVTDGDTEVSTCPSKGSGTWKRLILFIKLQGLMALSSFTPPL